MLTLWIGFFAAVLVMLALDLGVFHRESHAVGIREALGWTAVWMALGLAFGGLVYLIYERRWFGATVQAGPGQLTGGGLQAMGQYLTAYLLEKSLSVDNIFVISIIFGSFGVPARHQHRVLFWGILGALVARGAMIAGGVWLVARFTWVFYIFGTYLAGTGIRMLTVKHDPQGEGPAESWFTRLMRRLLPMAAGEHDGKFWAREEGRVVFTRLFLALLAVEATDVIFAVDSVPAVLAVSADPFIVVTSNVFAILGLRSL